MDALLSYFLLYNLNNLLNFLFIVIFIIFIFSIIVYVQVEFDTSGGKSGDKKIRIGFFIILTIFVIISALKFISPSKEQLEIYYNIDKNISLTKNL